MTLLLYFSDDYGGVDGNDLMALFNQVAVANKPPAPNATYPVEIRPQTRFSVGVK